MKTGEIIIPPQYIKVDGPVVFLAGPIRGAVDWQKEAMRYIREKSQTLHIASPRRSILEQDEFLEAIFDEQVDWEHHYLGRAAENGVTLFWLAKETNHRCDRAYAQTTRFELGEAVGRQEFTKAKIVVGIEEGFTGGKYISQTLAKKFPAVLLTDSLEEACNLAVKSVA